MYDTDITNFNLILKINYVSKLESKSNKVYAIGQVGTKSFR